MKLFATGNKNYIVFPFLFIILRCLLLNFKEKDFKDCTFIQNKILNISSYENINKKHFKLYLWTFFFKLDSLTANITNSICKVGCNLLFLPVIYAVECTNFVFILKHSFNISINKTWVLCFLLTCFNLDFSVGVVDCVPMWWMWLYLNMWCEFACNKNTLTYNDCSCHVFVVHRLVLSHSDTWTKSLQP